MYIKYIFEEGITDYLFMFLMNCIGKKCIINFTKREKRHLTSSSGTIGT